MLPGMCLLLPDGGFCGQPGLKVERNSKCHPSTCWRRDDVGPGLAESAWRSAITLMLFDAFAVTSHGARVAVLTFCFLVGGREREACHSGGAGWLACIAV